jgi:hypothetical protein
MPRSPLSKKHNFGDRSPENKSFHIPGLMHIYALIEYLNSGVLTLNSSKFFAGIIMILINVGSKFIQISFSKSSETYLKQTVSKEVLVFAMAWLGTRDIYTAFILMAIFVLLSDYLFNEETKFCIVPQQYRVLHKLIDVNNDGDVSDVELSSAIALLQKAKAEKNKKAQKQAFVQFNFQKISGDHSNF